MLTRMTFIFPSLAPQTICNVNNFPNGDNLESRAGHSSVTLGISRHQSVKIKLMRGKLAIFWNSCCSWNMEKLMSGHICITASVQDSNPSAWRICHSLIYCIHLLTCVFTGSGAAPVHNHGLGDERAKNQTRHRHLSGDDDDDDDHLSGRS